MELFFWIIDLSLPFAILIFGIVFLQRIPKKINYIFGFRTRMSMLSEETWRYAHHLCGILWVACGIILLPLITISKLLSQIPIEILSLIHVSFCLGTIIITTIIVEIALRKKFDKDGKPK